MSRWLLASAAVAVAAFALGASPAGLKLRVAVELLGWDGLMVVAREATATRILGARETRSRRAFHEAIDAVAEAELAYLVPNRRVFDADTLAEGHRLFMHLLQSASSVYFEADLDRPHFAPMVGPHLKLLGDNPDAYYHSTFFRRDGEYEVRGSLTGEDYLSFTVYEARCVGCFSQRVVADVNDRQITFEPDGSSFVIRLSKSKPPPSANVKNWISLDGVSPDAVPQLITRHYYERGLSVQLNASVTQNLTITSLTPLPPKRRAYTRLSDAESAERLERVAAFVTSHTTGMTQDPAAAPAWFSFKPNVFGAPVLFRDANQGQLGAVDIAYSAGPFKLPTADTHALLITGVMPSCVFANIVLWNVFMQTLSYERGSPVSLNRKQMRSLDGKTGEYAILLSQHPPKPGGAYAQADWLYTEGRTDGTMFWRFLLPNGTVATPQAKVVQVKLGVDVMEPRFP